MWQVNPAQKIDFSKKLLIFLCKITTILDLHLDTMVFVKTGTKYLLIKTHQCTLLYFMGKKQHIFHKLIAKRTNFLTLCRLYYKISANINIYIERERSFFCSIAWRASFFLLERVVSMSWYLNQKTKKRTSLRFRILVFLLFWKKIKKLNSFLKIITTIRAHSSLRNPIKVVYHAKWYLYYLLFISWTLIIF